MQSKLTSVEVAGFRGFLNRTTIEFGSGFTVITGRNGSGKSTIIDAIEYGITGRFSRDAEATESGETIANYVWWRNGRLPAERYVRIKVTPVDGLAQEASRTPDSPELPQLTDILIDEGAAPADGLETFLLTTIIRDETIARLSMDLNEARRYDFIKRAIGLSESLELENVARALQKDCDAWTSRINAEYTTLRERLSVLTSELSEARGASAAATKNSLEELREVMSAFVSAPASSLTELIAQGNHSLAVFRRAIDELEKLRAGYSALAALKGDYDRKGGDDEIQRVTQAKIEKLKLRAEAAAALESIKSVVSAVEVAAPLDTARAELADAGETLGLNDGACPLCGSSITPAQFEEQIHLIRDHVATHAGSFAALKRDRYRLEQQIAALDEDLSTIARLRSDLENARKTLAVEDERLEKIRLELLGARGADALPDVAMELSSRIRELDSLLGEIQATSSLDVVVRLERDLASQQLVCDEVNIRLTTAREASRLLKDIYDASRRAASEILDDRVDAMLPLLRELYSRLRPHAGWQQLDYKMRGDVKGFLSFSVGNGVNPRFVYSSGQRRALGLSFLLGAHLGRKWSKLDALILDDPVQHIDDYRALHLVEVLAAIRKTGRQVICAVEDSAIADLLCRRLLNPNDSGRRIELAFSVDQGMHVLKDFPIEPLPLRALLTA